MAEPDFVAFIEACYRVERSELDWLRGVALAAVPLIGFGLGIHGYFVDLDAESGPTLRDPILVAARPEWEERWRRNWWDALMVPMSAEHKKMLHMLCSVSYATEVWDAGVAKSTTYAEYMARFAARGYSTSHTRYLSGASAPPPTPTDDRFMYPESFNVGGIDATGHGAVLLANMPEAANGAVPPHEVGLWSRLGAHMAAGYRLLRKLRGRPFGDEADAILDPSGKVQHADRALRDTAALQALRAKVVEVDRVRADRRGDGRLAADVWHGLTEERYSLVDQFDRDGRRFYLARANVPQVDASATLTERELQVARAAALGHSNKLIAYELGITASTVATHLKAAATKLRVDSRLALIRLVRERLP